MSIFVLNLTCMVTSAIPMSGTFDTRVLLYPRMKPILTFVLPFISTFRRSSCFVTSFGCRVSSTSISRLFTGHPAGDAPAIVTLYTCTHRYRDFSSSYPFFTRSCVTRLNASSIPASSCRSLVSSWNIRCSRFLDLMGRVRRQMV